nr:ABC transporter permease [Lachnospiraceae bacterium]
SNTIDKESAVIGTLRASGYSKAELTVHYMSMPVIVTILGAILGNVLGYTAFKTMFVDLYYRSYSLPKLKLVISVTALIKTTVIPLLLMFFINLFVIVKKLQLSPLRFLRHDLSKSKRTKARRIPKWSFLGRFRLRNFFQNIPNYVILVFGVVFIELMMCFAFGLPDSLNHYGDKAADMMFTEYQYVLMNNKDSQGNIIETSKEGAEKFGMKDLKYDRADSSFRSGMGSGSDESVSVYGITEGSEYIKFGKAPGRGEAYVSSAYAAKYGIKKGDTISLHEEYEDKSYSFKIVGEVDYEGGIALFMELKEFNKTFGYDEDYFMGYFSHSEIEDLDKQYIATVITKDVVLRVTNQLMHSMGGMMNVFKYALIVLAAALIYLLTKIIIEKNEHSISMTKILGFKNTEIASLYMVPTAVVVLLCIGVSFIAGYYLMMWLFKIFMLQMDGYFAFYMRPVSMILSMLYVLVGYFVVTVIDFFRIKKIPMDIALKNVE